MESGLPVNTELLINQFGDMQETTHALCKEWLTVLTGHFQLLLNAGGDSYHELMRAGYRNKSSSLLFCQQIGGTETAFNMALLETIDGDSTALRQVTEAMTGDMKNLRSQSAEKFFLLNPLSMGVNLGRDCKTERLLGFAEDSGSSQLIQGTGKQ